MSRLDRISPWTAAGLALLLEPWGMVAAGAATVVEADLSHAAAYAALLGYCLLATSSLLAHQDPAVVSLSLLLGLYLVGRSIYQLTD